MSYKGNGREPHPVIALPSEEWLSTLTVEQQNQVFGLRAQHIAAMNADPLGNGYELESWKRADKALKEFREEYPVGVIIFLVLGGHRSAKTTWRAKRSVQALFRNDDYKIWACQATQEASRESQQIPIYNFLPPEYKADSGKLRRGKKLKVNYTPWGGFTEDVFAVENLSGGTSECRFKYYSMDYKSLEGAEINEGWADEEAKLDWMEALMYRLVSRNGILYMTFTPRWGYTQTVKTLLSGAETLLEGETDTELIAVRDARGNVLAAKKVPLVQQNLSVNIPGHRVKGRIVYFHTCENPFPLGNWQNMKETLRGASEDKILTTAYGVPTKSSMSMFPMFKDSVHIVALNRFREIQKAGGTWYHFLDPGSARNWFSCWIFCDGLGRAFVVGETPSTGHDWAYIPGIGDPGPWAVPGNAADGEQGDGQKEWGWGYARYIEEMGRMEKLLSADTVPIKVAARWIDARYGNALKTSEERSVTLIEDLQRLGMNFLAAPSEKFLYDQSQGGASVRMINDRLFYDPSKPVDLTNMPKLFCVETVPNVIYSLKEWTGRDGQRGATKDCIDCIRMFVLSGVGHLDEILLRPRTPWLNQFAKR